ncbi:MAG: hypothetical protein RL088_3417 [Verrucomicrobiota bacterium]|jgi:hypothetical protein
MRSFVAAPGLLHCRAFGPPRRRTEHWPFDPHSRLNTSLPPQPPPFTLVIGTFASTAYIHLQLEARRRLYPEVPLLVHDDASPAAGILQALCGAYGAGFIRTPLRLPPCKGDLSAFARGLDWARGLGADVLVKLSRRFLPLTDWRPSLAALAGRRGFATGCAWTTSFGFGFRSECTALSVQAWAPLAAALDARIAAPGTPFVEGLLHDLARGLSTTDAEEGRPPGCDGYAVWDWMGTDRCARTGNFLWHDWAHPRDYAGVARSWGLPYEEEDFADPNEGSGRGK